jgi:hypothetical protein
VNAAARGAGTSAALAVVIAGVGIFALGWIVANTRNGSMPPARLYDYVSKASAQCVGARDGWLYYVGRSSSRRARRRLLIGGYVTTTALPTWEIT